MKWLWLLLCCPFIVNAQTTSPVKWNFKAKKGHEANEYQLIFSAQLDKGFHVFAPEPGGDGLLIPTSVTLTHPELFTTKSPLIPQRRPVTKEMEGVGYVNYYEGEIEFILTVHTDKTNTVQGTLSFQCCNEAMCFPPRDIPFTINL